MVRSAIVLGFVGSGAVEKKNTTSLLRDWIDGNGGNVKAVLPMTREYWNEHLTTVADFLMAAEIPIEAIVDDSTAKMRELKPYLSAARKQYQSTAVPHKMTAVLGEAVDARLVVLWDDEDDCVHDTVRAVHKAGGIAMIDLTDGLDRIVLDNPDDEEAEEEEEFEEPTSDELPDADEAEDEDEEDEEAGEDDDEEEMEGEEDENEEESEDGDDADAEEDLDEEDEAAEFPDFEDGEFEMPEEDEENVLTELMETEAGPMTEFQGKLIALLERVVSLLESDAKPAGGTKTGRMSAAAPVKAAAAPKPAAKKSVAPPVKRAAKATTAAPAGGTVRSPAKKAPVKKAAPAPTTRRTVKPAAKKTAPAKKAPVASSNGSMTKKAAQAILDDYRPRRGRPPAEVTEAKKVLGLL
jgi:hypothetical protein